MKEIPRLLLLNYIYRQVHNDLDSEEPSLRWKRHTSEICH